MHQVRFVLTRVSRKESCTLSRTRSAQFDKDSRVFGSTCNLSQISAVLQNCSFGSHDYFMVRHLILYIKYFQVYKLGEIGHLDQFIYLHCVHRGEEKWPVGERVLRHLRFLDGVNLPKCLWSVTNSLIFLIKFQETRLYCFVQIGLKFAVYARIIAVKRCEMNKIASSYVLICRLQIFKETRLYCFRVQIH